MALPELLQALKDQAETQRSAELDGARAEAEAIRTGYERAAERRRAEFLGGITAEEEARGQRALSRARAEASAHWLAARNRLLERVRMRLSERVDAAASDEAYRQALADEVRQAVERLAPEAVEVRVPELLSAVVGDALRAAPAATVVPDETVAVGFVASADGGRRQIDGTLAARLTIAWPRLAVTVLAEADA